MTRKELVQEIRTLASGTLAKLFGKAEYASIDEGHAHWLAWAACQADGDFDSWQDAWEAYHKQVIIEVDDTEKHDDGCKCGRCNSNHRSYGAAILRCGTGELIERVYAPSEEQALQDARDAASAYTIVRAGHDND